MKKRILAFILGLFACFGLVACGKTTATTTTKKTRPSSDNTQVIRTTKPTQTTTTKHYTTLPLDLEGESLTISCSQINGGSYNSNWNNGTTIEGYRIGGYRIGSNAGTVIPDDTLYKNTAYEGRQGAVYNITPVTDIKALQITYSTQYTYTANPELPNVTFGDTKRCNDYKYTLEETNKTDITVTVNVNGIGFDYFSVNTGDFTLSLSTIRVIYSSTTKGETIVTPASGQGKVRINPYTYTGTKVAGQTKVTVPMEVEYNSETNTYVVTEEKTYTYYTFNYVRNHPECKSDATQIDPIDVANYFTIFGTWPANYAESRGSITTNTINSTFGKDTRQVSIYNRNDGYATSVPWNGTEYYYELDIDLDGKYTTGSRGSGRVVAWKSGFNATGYDNSPVCLYTDDHYNTWLEYYNNGTWSNRFNGEGNVTGVSFIAPTTVTLTGFDPRIVPGEGGGEDVPPTPGPGGGDQIPNVQIDDSKYYANYAPATMINEQTAKWQQVTNISGIVEGNRYMIAYGQGTETSFLNGSCWQAYNGVLEYVGSDYDRDYYDLKNYSYYFEKTEGGYYFCSVDRYDNKRYYRFGGAKSDLVEGMGLWQIAFSGGDFYLYTTSDGKNYALQRNYSNSNGNFFRTYQVGSTGNIAPVQLYRFCDIEGATPPIKPEQFYDYFEKVENVTNVKEKYEYLIVYYNRDDESVKNLTALNDATYKYEWNNLKASEKAQYEVLHFKKYTDKKGERYYEIYKIVDGVNKYLTCDENLNVVYSDTPSYFDFNNNNIGSIKPVYVDEDGYLRPLLINGSWKFFVYDKENECFAFVDDNSSQYFNQLLLFRVLDENNPDLFKSNYGKTDIYKVDEDDSYILVYDDLGICLTDFKGEGTYIVNKSYDTLEVSTDAEYLPVRYKSYVDGNIGVYYEIYYVEDGVAYYLSYEEYGSDVKVKFTSDAKHAYFTFINGGIILMEWSEEDEYIVNYYKDSSWWYLVYNDLSYCFQFVSSESDYYSNKLSAYKILEEPPKTTYEIVQSLDELTDEDVCIIVCLDSKTILNGYQSTYPNAFDISETGIITVKDGIDYETYKLEKNPDGDGWAIYMDFAFYKAYLCHDSDDKFGYRGDPCYLDITISQQDCSVKIKNPVSLDQVVYNGSDFMFYAQNALEGQHSIYIFKVCEQNKD